MMGNAGRVLMIPKGDYNAATTYEMLDCVYYNGRSYVCKQTSTGNAPTNTTYWQAMTPDSSAEIQALTNQVNGNWFNGGKNLYPLTLSAIKALNTVGTWSDNVYTRFDVTFEVMQEHGAVTGIKVNGTNTVSNNISLQLPATSVLNGSYTITGCPSDGSASTFWMRIGIGGSSTFVGNDTGEGKDVNISNATCDLMILLAPSATATNKVFKPMLRLATDSDPTYQPYAKTNVELTDAITDLSGLSSLYITAPSTATTAKEMILSVVNQVKALIPSSGDTALGSGIWEGHNYFEFKMSNTYNGAINGILVYGVSKIYTFRFETSGGGTITSCYSYDGTAV